MFLNSMLNLELRNYGTMPMSIKHIGCPLANEQDKHLPLIYVYTVLAAYFTRNSITN